MPERGSSELSSPLLVSEEQSGGAIPRGRSRFSTRTPGTLVRPQKATNDLIIAFPHATKCTQLISCFGADPYRSVRHARTSSIVHMHAMVTTYRTNTTIVSHRDPPL